MMNATTPRALVAGNWKMHGLRSSLTEAQTVAAYLERRRPDCDVMICPPATLLSSVVQAAAATPLAVGAQNCHSAVSGAHTGDVSAEMLADAGASAVIVGHSERRSDHGETDADVRAKAEAAHRSGLVAIICVGENERQRAAGQTLQVVRMQLDGSIPGTITAANTVIAYEPVWAIGTGLTPTVEDVAQVHDMIRNMITGKSAEHGHQVRILYGGSVKPANAVELMGVPNVNGALVGGASLKADDFLGIVAAYETN